MMYNVDTDYQSKNNPPDHFFFGLYCLDCQILNLWNVAQVYLLWCASKNTLFHMKLREQERVAGAHRTRAVGLWWARSVRISREKYLAVLNDHLSSLVQTVMNYWCRTNHAGQSNIWHRDNEEDKHACGAETTSNKLIRNK